MTTTLTAIAAQAFLLYSPSITSEIFVVLTAFFVFAFTIVLSVLTAFAVIVAIAARGHRYVPENEYGLTPLSFNELEFFPYLAIFATSFIAAFQQFFSAFTSTASAIVSTVFSVVASNLGFFITAIVLSGFAALYLIEPEQMYPIKVAAWNGFLGPLVKITVLPLAAIVAYLSVPSIILTNFVSRLTKTGTTSALLHVFINGIAAIAVALMLLGTAVQQYGLAQQAWITQPTPAGTASQTLVVAPNFIGVGFNLGLAASQLINAAAPACTPLAPFVFTPLAAPFTSTPFELAVNSTLALPYVVIGQAVLRPVAQYLFNLEHNGGGIGAFGTNFPGYSLNSTFDTINVAQRNAFLFLDQFPVQFAIAFNTLVIDLTGIPFPSLQTLPGHGLFSIMFGGPFDILLTFGKLTANLVIDLLTVGGHVYSYPDGILPWLPDELFARINAYAGITTQYADFLDAYITQLGINISNQHPAAGGIRSVIRKTFAFVGGLIGKLPCAFTKFVAAILNLLELAVNLAVGTVYTFISGAINGKSLSPFLYAQQLYGDFAHPGANLSIAVECRVVVAGHPNTFLTLFSFHDFFNSGGNTGVTLTCPRVPIIQYACVLPSFDDPINPVFNAPVPDGFDDQRQSEPFAFAFEYIAVQPLCAANPSLCSVEIVQTNTNTAVSTPIVNRYRDALEQLAAPVVCVFDLISSLCVSIGSDTSTCPLDAAVAQNTVDVLVNMLDYFINALVHLDKVATSYFFQPDCFPIQYIPLEAEMLLEVFTNTIRGFIDGIYGPGTCARATPGGLGDGGNSGLLPCCAVGIVDSSFGILASIVTSVIQQIQQAIVAFLPASVGGGGQSSFEPAPFVFDNATWVPSLSASLVCIPLSALPDTLKCDATNDVVSDNIGPYLADAVTQLIEILPNIATSIINGVVHFFFHPSPGSVASLLDSVIDNILHLFGSLLNDASVVLNCAENGNPLSIAFNAVSGFLLGVAEDVIHTIVDLVINLFEFVIGFFQFITGGGTDTLNAAFQGLLVDFFKNLIDVFGVDAPCGLAAAICFFSDNGIHPLTLACIQAGHSFNSATTCTNDPSEVGGRKRSIVFADDCFDVITSYGFDAAQIAYLANSTDPAAQEAIACYAEVTSPAAVFAHIAAQRTLVKSIGTWVSKTTSATLEAFNYHVASTQRKVELLHSAQVNWAQTTALTLAGTPRAPPAVIVSLDTFVRGFSGLALGEPNNDTHAILVATHKYDTDRHIVRKRSVFASMPRDDSFLVNLVTAGKHIALARRVTPKWWHDPALAVVVEPQRAAEPQPTHISLAAPYIKQTFMDGFNRAAGKIADAALSMIGRQRDTSRQAPSVAESAIEAARQFTTSTTVPQITYAPSRGYTSLAEWHTSGDLVAPLAVSISPNLPPLLGLPTCDDTQQLICTGCAYVDDLILVTQESAHSAAAFYTAGASQRASNANLTAQLEQTFQDELVNPAGNTTYTTLDRPIPPISRRLWNVRWFWLWDYSEFVGLVAGTPSSPGCANFSDVFSAANVTVDSTVQQAFDTLFSNIEHALATAICKIGSQPLATAQALYQRYVVCDYDGALYCPSAPDGTLKFGVGLFDGFVNSVLLLAFLGLLITEFPGGSMIIMMVAMPVVMFGTFWIGYGASPACTLPAVISGVGAYPVCIGMDAYRLLEETLYEPDYPPGFIQPSDLAEFSHVLITAPDPIPEPRNCSTLSPVAFTSIYDNFFFSTASLLGDSFNQKAAATVGALDPSIAESALKWNSTTLAALEADFDIGNFCNRLTFPKILFGILGIALAVGKAVASVFTLVFTIPFIAFMLAVLFAALFILNVFGTQADRYYISDSRQDY
jgi:hypothetical protein